jgi:transcriptional regulator with XRE-family HTH domain
VITDRGAVQNQLAKKIGVTRGQISSFMHGKRGLSVEALERLAAVLDLEIIVRPKKRKGR